MQDPPLLQIPEFSLVLLIGISSSGKSTFAARHFGASEVLSSDHFRGLVADDETDQSASADAFELLHALAAKRLKRRLLTVIDATNLQHRDRKPLLDLARKYHALTVAIVFNLPEAISQERRAQRPDRNFGPEVIRRQAARLQAALPGLKGEGFWRLYSLWSEAEVARTMIQRVPLLCDLREERGPFDIIGDLHGCCDELELLLEELGYRREKAAPDEGPVTGPVHRDFHPHSTGRKAIFVGDLVDRGPRNLDCFQLVHSMVRSGGAYCVPGNHDIRLVRKLEGRDVRIQHGLDITLAEIRALPEQARSLIAQEMINFFRPLPSHYVLDGGRLVVAHAGMKEELQGRISPQVRAFALYGDTTGHTDAYGLPVRSDWTAHYTGSAYVIYGHTAVRQPGWMNRTLNIDTGCVFGGRLTALRYPEMELISVPAARRYADPIGRF